MIVKEMLLEFKLHVHTSSPNVHLMFKSCCIKCVHTRTFTLVSSSYYAYMWMHTVKDGDVIVNPNPIQSSGLKRWIRFHLNPTLFLDWFIIFGLKKKLDWFYNLLLIFDPLIPHAEWLTDLATIGGRARAGVSHEPVWLFPTPGSGGHLWVCWWPLTRWPVYRARTLLGLASQDIWVRQAPKGDTDHQLFQARMLVQAWLTRFVGISPQGSAWVWELLCFVTKGEVGPRHHNCNWQRENEKQNALYSKANTWGGEVGRMKLYSAC